MDKVSSHTKISNCKNVYTSKIGLYSFEDYVYANNGETAVYTEGNFFSNDSLEWTLSTFDNNNLWITWFNVNMEYITYAPVFSKSNTYGHGVRPVISIKADTIVSSGSGANSDPFVLINESQLNPSSTIDNLKIGNYIYLDESNNPNSFTFEKVDIDIKYNTTKDKVRYRVIDINNNGIKVQRADILRNLDSNVSSGHGTNVPFYYKSTGSEDELCYFDADNKYVTGCKNHNVYRPNFGSGNYSYKDSENVGYFLNNADNSFYSWYSDKTKKMIINTDFSLVTDGYGKDYSNLDSGSGGVYPATTNDGIVSVRVGLPSWGDMYTGNDTDYSYWFINRRYNNLTNVAGISSSGNGLADYVGATWYALRPVVSLNLNCKIVSGKGTMTEPYSLTM